MKILRDNILEVWKLSLNLIPEEWDISDWNPVCLGDYILVDGVKVKKYRGMGSLEAQQKGSESRYYGDTQTLKIAQGVSGTVKDKGSVR